MKRSGIFALCKNFIFALLPDILKKIIRRPDMKQLKILVILLCLTAGFVITNARKSDAEPDGMMIPGGKWWRMPNISDKLKLTQEEQKKLDSLFIQSRNQLITIKSNMEKGRLELEEILDKKEFDESACMDRFKKIQDTRSDLAAERFKYFIEVRKILGEGRFQTLKADFQENRLNRMKAKEGKKRLMKEEPVQE